GRTSKHGGKIGSKTPSRRSCCPASRGARAPAMVFHYANSLRGIGESSAPAVDVHGRPLSCNKTASAKTDFLSVPECNCSHWMPLTASAAYHGHHHGLTTTSPTGPRN